MPNRGVRRHRGRARAGVRTVVGMLLAVGLIAPAVSATAVVTSPLRAAGALSATTVSDDADQSLRYGGSWAPTMVSGERMTRLTGPGSLEYDFAGTSVNLYGARSPDGALLEVLVDGVTVTTVDTAAASTAPGILAQVTGLTDAAHTLRVVSTGRRDAARGPVTPGTSPAPTPTSTPTSTPGASSSFAPTTVTIGSVVALTAPSVSPVVRLDVDPGSAVARAVASTSDSQVRSSLMAISRQPLGTWFGEWSGDIRSAVRARVDGADARGGVATLVMYAIPHRDCGGHSAGDAMTADRYRAWVTAFVAGLGTSRHLVIVEPDALTLTDCLDGAQSAERFALLKFAVDTISAQGSAAYLDAGHSDWLTPAVTAERLRLAGVGGAAGFSLNVSNTQATAREIAHGTAVSGLVGGTHFVIDTGRNGAQTTPGDWCNPTGAGLGMRPTTVTASPLVDAYLWIKPPGESDGPCKGAPAAGQWHEAYARALVANASR
ncbi:MAG: hypothetical protein RI885_222 [Actinomycetota bacterium]